jgi:hypothetical protein
MHSHVFVLASLLHIKTHKNLNTWAQEGPHISEKPKKKWDMKAHNIILEFAPSGMCETNIYREKISQDQKENKFQCETNIYRENINMDLKANKFQR